MIQLCDRTRVSFDEPCIDRGDWHCMCTSTTSTIDVTVSVKWDSLFERWKIMKMMCPEKYIIIMIVSSIYPHIMWRFSHTHTCFVASKPNRSEEYGGGASPHHVCACVSAHTYVHDWMLGIWKFFGVFTHTWIRFGNQSHCRLHLVCFLLLNRNDREQKKNENTREKRERKKTPHEQKKHRTKRNKSQRVMWCFMPRPYRNFVCVFVFFLLRRSRKTKLLNWIWANETAVMAYKKRRTPNHMPSASTSLISCINHKRVDAWNSMATTQTTPPLNTLQMNSRINAIHYYLWMRARIAANLNACNSMPGQYQICNFLV